MTSSATVPVSFELPDGWTPIPPQSIGTPGASFAAVRESNAADPVVTNLVIGFHPGRAPADLGGLAEAHLADLRSQYPVAVRSCDTGTAGAAAEYSQLLDIAYPVGESTLDLTQIRILLALPGAGPGDPAGVMQVVMTCPARIFDQAGREFQRFLATITPTP